MKAPTLWKRWGCVMVAVAILGCGLLTWVAARVKGRVEELCAIQAQVNDEIFIPVHEEANIFVDGPEAFRHTYVPLENSGSGGLS